MTENGQEEVAVPEEQPERYSRHVSTWSDEDRAAHAEVLRPQTTRITEEMVVCWEADWGPTVEAICARTGLTRTEALLFWAVTKIQHLNRQTDGLIAAYNSVARAAQESKEETADLRERSRRLMEAAEREISDEPWRQGE